eukprot:TRINITY_DN40941_c0_g1_i1.p1 TRINITY_DN40941_c0_g1~~TRINITY_DN40941_c0_g1_i1.p1  ORF type:complete len:290 (+),score=61.28 TRINITY_DN40941_c0_g1_i1:40-909(+)
MAPRRGQSRRGAALAGLALVLAALYGSAAFIQSPAGSIARHITGAPLRLGRTSNDCRTARRAEEEEEEASDSDETSDSDGSSGNDEAPASEVIATKPLFQELNVSNSTSPRKLMGAMVAIFNNGDRAVDLVLTDPRAKGTLMYGILNLPDAFRAAAQVLLRRRDRRLRIRVLQHFQPVPDKDPEVLRISKATNSTKLGSAIMSKFVDIVGNNLQRTVKLQFQGMTNAATAIMAIEKAGHKAHREFTFMPRKVFSEPTPSDDSDSDSGSEDAEGSKPNVQMSIEVTLVAT